MLVADEVARRGKSRQFSKMKSTGRSAGAT